MARSHRSLLERAIDAGVTDRAHVRDDRDLRWVRVRRRPFAGVDVDVDGDRRVRVRGPVLFDGYLGDDGGWLGRRVVRHQRHRSIVDGTLTVEGRSDNVINTGGVKVPAEAVERALAR